MNNRLSINAPGLECFSQCRDHQLFDHRVRDAESRQCGAYIYLETSPDNSTSRDDASLNTFSAEVNLVLADQEEGDNDRDDNLLLWIGTNYRQIATVEELGQRFSLALAAKMPIIQINAFCGAQFYRVRIYDYAGRRILRERESRRNHPGHLRASCSPSRTPIINPNYY